MFWTKTIELNYDKLGIRPLLTDKLGNNSTQNSGSYYCIWIVIDRISGVITRSGNTFCAFESEVTDICRVTRALELYPATNQLLRGHT